jgi:hypothetical protein
MIKACRPLRGLLFLYANDPGVSLRSTPGFMPTSAPRTEYKNLLLLDEVPGVYRTRWLDTTTIHIFAGAGRAHCG